MAVEIPETKSKDIQWLEFGSAAGIEFHRLGSLVQSKQNYSFEACGSWQAIMASYHQ